MPDMYGALAYSSGRYNGYNTADTAWDFTRFQPDIVVICLGANDQTYTGNSEELKREYTDGYVEFLKQIRGHNPDAYLMCCLMRYVLPPRNTTNRRATAGYPLFIFPYRTAPRATPPTITQPPRHITTPQRCWQMKYCWQ